MIKIKNITKIYRVDKESFCALDSISLHVKSGEAILLRGHSGSGKSTLLSIIGGLLKPTSGSVHVDGVSLAKIPDDYAALFRREHVGFIFQKYNLIPDISVLDNVLTPLLPTKMAYSQCIQKALNAMQIASIGHKKDQLVATLSGGEQQRVAIARALVHEASVLLADEPSANLDPTLTQAFLNEMFTIKDLGKTIVIASHDEMLLKSSLFDRVIVLEGGKILDFN
jgi:putative ABC transport system ATP-binding protein